MLVLDVRECWPPAALMINQMREKFKRRGKKNNTQNDANIYKNKLILLCKFRKDLLYSVV